MFLCLWILIFCFVYSYVGATSSALKCDDVDTSACVLLQAQQADFCKNDVVARSICPRFCKMCPVECYHCDTTFTDYHKCNTTILCQEGEVCMRKELISFMDGHHEYELTCQDRRICDGGNDLTIPFGKRHVNARDISIKCCINDLCNYPEVTTTTSTTTATTTTKKPSCEKDIIFMVDVSRNRILEQHDQQVKNLLTLVIGRLDIGPTDNLVAYYHFDNELDTQIDFRDINSKHELLSRIDDIDIDTGDSPNISIAIHEVFRHTISHYGDRPGYPDVVVIIGNYRTTDNLHMSSTDMQRLQQLSRDVIVVDIGSDDPTSPFARFFHPQDGLLATDNNHILLTSYSALGHNNAQIVDQLYQLIIQC
ncbi:collagen [Mactra antiquata]